MSTQEAEKQYQAALRYFELVKEYSQKLEDGNTLKLAGHDSGGGGPLPVTDIEIERTKRAADIAENIWEAAVELSEALDVLFQILKRMKEDQEAEVITDDDLHPGVNNPKTWVNPRGDYP